MQKRKVVSLQIHLTYVKCVSFTKDGSLMASGGSDFLVIVWNVAMGSVLFEIWEHLSPINSLFWDSTQSCLYSIDENGDCFGVELS